MKRPPGNLHQDISIDPGAFAAAFPFGFVVDRSGVVVMLGKALERRVSSASHCSVTELFEDASPRPFRSIEDGLRTQSAAVILRVKGTEVVLRGEGIELAGDGSIAFIGSPMLKSLDELQSCGLQLRDFAAADSTPDLLLSMQATKTALMDTRELSERLEASVAKANAAVLAKSRFLAVMSHEIRTPMNGLGSMVDLLRDSGLSDAQEALCTTIDECVSTLGLLVDDVLDLSKIEADAVSVEVVPVAVPELVHSVVRMFTAVAQDNDVQLVAALDPVAPTSVLGDPTRIRQVLSNLVSNGIKFSQGGTVTVRVSQAECGDLEVRVADTGIGIPGDAQGALFQPFSQADSSTTRRFGGTGLGLSIARGLANAMGGSLDLESSSPGGAVFLFTVRVPSGGEGSITGDDPIQDSASLGCDAGLRSAASSAGASATESSAVVEAFPEGISVLVADDNPVNLLVAERLLKRLGVKATTVNDGSKAVDAVRETAFDAVLMDVMMPDVDGLEATRRIRDLSVAWSGLPILAFTAGVVSEAREEAKAAGMDGFLTKPVRLQGLHEALVKHLRT